MHALCSVILDSSDSNSHAYVTIWSQRNLGLCLHTIHYEWMLTMLTYFKINLDLQSDRSNYSHNWRWENSGWQVDMV